MPLTAPSGLGCALRRKGPGCALDCLLDAPWLGPRLGLSLGCALACSLDCFGAKSAQGRIRGESSLVLFLGTVSFCLTGKKIPNVVGFGTFPNVVGFPSLRTVSRIEAALQGALTLPSMEGALTAPYIGARLRLGLPLGRALAWDCFALGRAWGESSLDPFLGTSSFCLTGKKIPNVVGFGTFPNVVGFPSLQTVPRIEAALQGGINCAFYGAWLRLALLWRQECTGADVGGIEPGAFFWERCCFA